MLPAARILTVPTTTGDHILATGLWVVVGWSFRETTGGAAASFDLYDGRDANSRLFAAITLTAGESTRDLTAANGIVCETGIFFDRLAGTIKGAVWAVPGVDYNAWGAFRGVREAWAGPDETYGDR